MSEVTKVNVAIVDLYNGEENQGMRCIQELVRQSNEVHDDIAVEFDIFDTRQKSETPGLNYDIYISTGGPGSPFDGEGKKWERRYFNLIDDIWEHNQLPEVSKKHVFFICHSFQMMARFFNIAAVQKRYMQSFGILPVRKTLEGDQDFLTEPLPEVYYAADFRQYEVISPDIRQLESLGARIISRENMRINPAFEKALMAVRMSAEIFGTQYHPEADPASMLFHFQQPMRKKQVVNEYGEAKYHDMISHLEDPENILLTRRNILPRFLKNAIVQLRPEAFVPQILMTN